jgi:hypothetical protein
MFLFLRPIFLLAPFAQGHGGLVPLVGRVPEAYFYPLRPVHGFPPPPGPRPTRTAGRRTRAYPPVAARVAGWWF